MPSPNLRILCVDDNEDTCFILSTLLGREYETKTAGGVTEALLAAAGREHFDLYVLDTIFPDGRGTDLCLRLRSLHPQTPIIFYSGAAFAEDRRAALSAGAIDYIVKPEINGLVEAVRRVLA